MMDKDCRKKLERVLQDKGVTGIDWPQIEETVLSEFNNDENAKNYLNRPYSEFDMDECPILPVEIPLNDGFIINVEGSFKKIMDTEDQPVTLTNIDAVYVTDPQGNKSKCDFEYTYGLNQI